MFDVLGITFKISFGMFTGWILVYNSNLCFVCKGSEYFTTENSFSWRCEICQKHIIIVFPMGKVIWHPEKSFQW